MHPATPTTTGDLNPTMLTMFQFGWVSGFTPDDAPVKICGGNDLRKSWISEAKLCICLVTLHWDVELFSGPGLSVGRGSVTTMHFPLPFRPLSGPVLVLAWFPVFTSNLLSRCNLYFWLGICLTCCCARLVLLMHTPLGFRNEGLLSVPQIKHMIYATLLLSFCSYCLSLHLLSLTYFLPHSNYLRI
jgi:hypothetical protein